MTVSARFPWLWDYNLSFGRVPPVDFRSIHLVCDIVINMDVVVNAKSKTGRLPAVW